MDINNIPEPEESNSSKHPTPEQLFIREAAKHLTAKQKKIWDYHNFDKLTQDEIAVKLNISQQAVSDHINACEARIAKWCKNSMYVYELIVQQMGKEADDVPNGINEAKAWSHKTPSRHNDF